jgi:hypothetical protein
LISFCVGGMPHTIGKILTTDTTLLWISSRSEVYRRSYGPPKSQESQFWEFWDSNLGVSKQNDIWVLALWPCTENTIRGKVVASQSLGHGESCESVFARGSSMHQKCSNYALTNLLFSLWRSLWVIDSLVTLPNPHPKALAHPYAPKVLWAKECAPTPYPSTIFTFKLTIESNKEFGGVNPKP